MLNYSTTELIPLGTVGLVPSNNYYIPMSGFNLHVPNFSLVGTFRLNPFLLESSVLELLVEDERSFVRLLVLVLVLGRNGEMKIRLLPHGR